MSSRRLSRDALASPMQPLSRAKRGDMSTNVGKRGWRKKTVIKRENHSIPLITIAAFAEMNRRSKLTFSILIESSYLLERCLAGTRLGVARRSLAHRPNLKWHKLTIPARDDEHVLTWQSCSGPEQITYCLDLSREKAEHLAESTFATLLTIAVIARVDIFMHIIL